MFAEPWQAQAFALAVKLSEQGHFTWKEWAAALAAELKAASERGEPDDGSRYYEHWLAALERLVTSRGLTGTAALNERKEAWADAYRHTPHGKPVALGEDQPMTVTTKRPKEYYHQRSSAEMNKHLLEASWSARQKVALTCRILAEEGHESALAGQISSRADKPGTYWMLRFGLGFDEASASNVQLVDDDLKVLEGEGMANPANRFHLWIYRNRPEINCIVHTHPPYCSALSIIGEPLEPAHMDTSMFYDDCAWLPEWPGVPIGDEEGEIISNAIGNKRAILLAHHGQLCACKTMEEACVLAIFIERAARMQLLARSAGTIKKIKPELAKEAHDYRLKPKAIGATFHYFARRVLRKDAECLK